MKHIHVDRCDSTQDVLKEQLNREPSADYLVSSNTQTQGRGRGANIWQDSLGTICFSMTVAPHVKSSFTALELSVLVARFFEVSGHQTKVKWPNDLLTKQNRKCAGVLIQSSGQRYLAGVGINLFSASSEFGGIHDSPFTFDKAKWSLEVAKFISDNRYSSTESLIRDWEDRCSHMNETVRITDDKHEVEGTFRGLGEHGEALLETVNGTMRIYNGSLRLL